MPNGQPDGETIQSLIFHGVDLGQIVSVGTVADYFPEPATTGATNVKDVPENFEMNQYGLDNSDGRWSHHADMINRHCLPNIGNVVPYGPNNSEDYDTSQGQPLDGPSNLSLLSNVEWYNSVFVLSNRMDTTCLEQYCIMANKVTSSFKS